MKLGQSLAQAALSCLLLTQAAHADTVGGNADYAANLPRIKTVQRSFLPGDLARADAAAGSARLLHGRINPDPQLQGADEWRFVYEYLDARSGVWTEARVRLLVPRIMEAALRRASLTVTTPRGEQSLSLQEFLQGKALDRAGLHEEHVHELARALSALLDRNKLASCPRVAQPLTLDEDSKQAYSAATAAMHSRYEGAISVLGWLDSIQVHYGEKWLIRFLVTPDASGRKLVLRFPVLAGTDPKACKD